MVMKAFPLSLLAATTVLLLLLPVPAHSDCLNGTMLYLQPTEFGKSKHIITFKGTKWDEIVISDEAKLRKSLLLDIYLQTQREYAVNTTVTINNMKVREGEMEVEVTVTQVALADDPTPELQHVWNPSEANSMIMQGKFEHTKSTYKPHGDVELITVRLPLVPPGPPLCGTSCQILRGVVAVSLAAMTIIVSVTAYIWIYSHFRRPKLEERD
ncbi:hypothetical protein, conserved [Trypanosoma brucei brucei TREU927]|uniref:Uncharacterized protein n=1 Tax=Trypanosoma brucei brucei (strain 927/4 GUTat10.1) TaxID=185431 RepID=Q57UQ8_TRYB2|nr:hypothetical protein, conserved [Trypanosoma brucei brucei TREU927]AAX70661.1 hypothetical protein, conserved [Trypanosoma brucei]AAZ12492.1 hypothetical protein, conserved [Trypanosoma brucei brucei TREU927]